MAEMRETAEELISDIMAELRLTLRKLESPSQRRIQRSYGAQFKYLKGETVDPDDKQYVEQEDRNRLICSYIMLSRGLYFFVIGIMSRLSMMQSEQLRIN